MFHCFVREEGEHLVLCAGIPSQWLSKEEDLYFGPAYTSFGKIKIWIKPRYDKITVSWECTWYKKPTKIEVRLFEHSPATTSTNSNSVELIQAKNKS